MPPTHLLPWIEFADQQAIRELADALPAGLLMTDLQGRITYWNRAAQRITGRSQEEVLGTSCRVVAGDRATGCACRPEHEACPLLAGQSESFSRCCTLETADGSRMVVFKNAVPLRDQVGRQVGAIETFVDVTGLTSVECHADTIDVDRPAAERSGRGGLVGSHPEMQHLCQLIDVVAQSDATVMILGESGTGKELVARAIHEASPRRGGPFVAVNCSMFNENLLETELFGHVKGAFTGAVEDRSGRFEEAAGGTLLLDEIGDASPGVQLKLLRVVQQREIERVGESQATPVDIRLLCATHHDLRKRVEQGRFRADLFFRLNVFPLQVPPLRERLSDLPELIEHLVARQPEPRPSGVTEQALQLMAVHGWPGNVRELENTLAFATLLACGEAIATEHLPPELRSARCAAALREPADRPRAPSTSREALIAALDRHDWNRTRTAAALGISRVTLWKRMKRLGISVDPR